MTSIEKFKKHLLAEFSKHDVLSGNKAQEIVNNIFQLNAEEDICHEEFEEDKNVLELHDLREYITHLEEDYYDVDEKVKLGIYKELAFLYKRKTELEAIVNPPVKESE